MYNTIIYTYLFYFIIIYTIIYTYLFYKLMFYFYQNKKKNWINNSNYNQLSIPKKFMVELDSLYNNSCLCWKIYNANNWVRSRKWQNLTDLTQPSNTRTFFNNYKIPVSKTVKNKMIAPRKANLIEMFLSMTRGILELFGCW